MEKIVSWIKSPFVESVKSYFVKALIVFLLLLFLAKMAPMMPLFLLLIAMVAYAAVAMMGSLHFVVMHRKLRRFKLRESGSLAKLNQRWTMYAAVLFLLSLASALMFVLQAPNWGAREWKMLFVAALLYWLVFYIALRQFRRELADGFDKAAAMKWSYWITGVIICIAYVVLFSQGNEPKEMTMAYAFSQVPTPYADNPCILLSDMEMATSFFDGLKVHALNNMPGAYSWVSILVDAVMFAAVFFGLSSQLCFCMLNSNELKAEFQTLPSSDAECGQKQPFRKGYFIVTSAVALAFVIAFVVIDGKLEEIRNEGGATPIEAEITAWRDELILLYDTKIEKQAIESEMSNELLPLLDAYYEKCQSNVDFYVASHRQEDNGWLENARDWLVSLFGANDEDVETVRNEFVEQISAGANGDAVENVYEEYRNQLIENNRVANEGYSKLSDWQLAGVDLPDKLDLWQSLDDDAVRNVLLKRNLTREDLRSEIKKLIESAHQNALNVLDALVEDSNQQNE